MKELKLREEEVGEIIYALVSIGGNKICATFRIKSSYMKSYSRETTTYSVLKYCDNPECRRFS